MNAASILPGWYPLMRSGALGRRPVRRTLVGTALILARNTSGVISATEASSHAPRAVRIEDGWIFAAHGDAMCAAPYVSLIPKPCRSLLLDGVVGARLADVGENILDTTHTSVVHQGYLRGSAARRSVEAKVDAGDGWISATYPPGAAPDGWGARLLGAGGYTIRDTFRAPSIAEVVYSRRGQPAFAGRFHLTPVSETETYVAVTLWVPGGGLLARLKLTALRVFFRRILAEDRFILELIGSNRAAHGAAPLIYAPQDIVRPGIDAILEGRSPAPARPRTVLKV